MVEMGLDSSALAEPAFLAAAARLVDCGCIDGKFRRENRIFASVSEDGTHQVVLTLDADGEWQDAACDCGAPLPCLHCLGVWLDHRRQPESYPVWDEIRRRLETMEAEGLRSLLSRAFFLYPALLCMLESDSRDLAGLCRDVRRMFRMFEPGGGRPTTLNRLLGIFRTEVCHFEKIGRTGDAVSLLETLLDEVTRILPGGRYNPESLPVLPELQADYLRLTPRPDRKRLARLHPAGRICDRAVG